MYLNNCGAFEGLVDINTFPRFSLNLVNVLGGDACVLEWAGKGINKAENFIEKVFEMKMPGIRLF